LRAVKKYPEGTYEGPLSTTGLRHGKGKMYYGSGSIYKGNW